jgi:hypothetical protein
MKFYRMAKIHFFVEGFDPWFGYAWTYETVLIVTEIARKQGWIFYTEWLEVPE